MTITRNIKTGNFTVRGPDGKVHRNGIDNFPAAKRIEEQCYRELDVTPPRYTGVYCTGAKNYIGVHIETRNLQALLAGRQGHNGTPILRKLHIGNFQTIKQARKAADVVRLLLFARTRLNMPLADILPELARAKNWCPKKELLDFLLDGSKLDGVRMIWLLGKRQSSGRAGKARERMLKIHARAREDGSPSM